MSIPNRSEQTFMSPLKRLLSVYLVVGIWCSVAALREVNQTELQLIAKDNSETVVYFYAKWCQQCESFQPIYASVAGDYQKSGLNFVKFDAGSNRMFAAPLVDDTYPGVVLFRGADYVDHMRAAKTRENLERWIEQMTGHPIELLKNEDEAKKHAKRFPVAFVVGVPSKNSLGFETVLSVATEHRDWAKWFVVINGTKNIASVKHPYEKMKSIEFSNAQELTEWAAVQRFPLFGPLDASNQHAYYQRGLDPTMFVGSEKDFKDHGITFRKLALSHKDAFSFVWFNSNQEGARSTLHNMMVRKVPGFVVFTGTGNKREHKRFIYPDDDLRDSEKISQFLNDVLAKKIRPNVKSKPNSQSGSPVLQVTGDNFEEMVFHNDRDFMLVLTAPKGNDMFKGCVKCEPLIQMLEKVSPAIDAEVGPLIRFGEFLVTENEIPLFNWGGTWSWEDLPVIYLVKAGAKIPLEHKGHTDVPSLLEFWENNTDSRIVQEKQLSKMISVQEQPEAKREEL